MQCVNSEDSNCLLELFEICLVTYFGLTAAPHITFIYRVSVQFCFRFQCKTEFSLEYYFVLSLGIPRIDGFWAADCSQYKLTLFQRFPFIPSNSDVLKFHAGLSKQQTNCLSACAYVEIEQFIRRHGNLEYTASRIWALSVYQYVQVSTQVTQALSSYLMFIYMASNERGIL